MVKSNILENITSISIKTDNFDIIVRDSISKDLKIYFDSKSFKGKESLGSLLFDELEKSIIFELYERDLFIDKKIKCSELNPAIIVELPIDKDLKIFIMTEKSDIYISAEILEHLNKKIFCKSDYGSILRKCFMYFEEVGNALVRSEK